MLGEYYCKDCGGWVKNALCPHIGANKPCVFNEGDYMNIGLCHRCEYRAQYNETKQQPRYECGDGGAVHSCYMYKPVKPLVLAPSDKKDKRPFLGPPIIASRSMAVRVAECDFVAKECKDGVIVYCKPKGKENNVLRIKK